MRRVRSQLNNLAAMPAHSEASVQQPLGYSHHTDEIQRRIETTGVLQDQYAQTPIEPSYMPQGNVAQNHMQHPMYQNPHPQNYHVPVHNMQSAPIHPQHSPRHSSQEIDNIKASLERLTQKLQGLMHNQSNNTAQNSLAQQTSNRISEQYKIITSEMRQINESIAQMASSVAQNHNDDHLKELKTIIEQQQDMFLKHIKSTQSHFESAQSAQINPDAYAEAVETSHSQIAEQVDELRSLMDQTFSSLQNSDNSNIEQAVLATSKSQAELLQRVAQLETNLESNLVDGQTEIINQINTMQQSIAFLQTKPAEQHVLDTSSLDMHLEEINRAIVALSASNKGMDNLERIEARISHVSKMLDETQTAALQQAPMVDMDGIFSKFDVVNASIENLGNNLSNRSPEKDESIDGLAAQINKLSEKLDNISSLPAIIENDNGENGTSYNGVLERLDELVGRVSNIEVPTLDSSIFNTFNDQIGEIKNQIEGLTNSVRSNTGSDEEVDAVMEQLKYISSTVYQLSLAQETGESGQANGQMLSDLGSQIEALSNQIANFESVGLTEESFAPISNRLIGIEEQLAASRDIAIELASQAAKEAVETTVSQVSADGQAASIDLTPIQQLSEQVQYLREANDTMNSSNIETIDTVKDIFSMMAERLSSIENQVMQGSAPSMYNHGIESASIPTEDLKTSSSEQAFENDMQLDEQFEVADMPQEVAEANAHDAKEDAYTEQAYDTADIEDSNYDEPTVDIELPEQGTPGIMSEFEGNETGHEIDLASDEMSVDNSQTFNNDMPIEPGSGAPDLAMLVRQAKERRSGASESDMRSNSGNQFRQMAKDAMRVAQINELEDTATNKQSSSETSSLVSKLAANKKVVIIAAAAALLIAVTVPLAAKFFASNTQTAENTQQSEYVITNDDDGNVVISSDIKSYEELQALQSASSEASNLELSGENIISSEPADDPKEITSSEATNESEPVAVASASNSLFSSEPTSVAEGFGVETASEKVGAKVKETYDLAFGSDELKAAITNNEPMALFEAGRRYTDGAGVEKDLEEAAKWYERSAELGFAPAQYIIGNFNEKGIGIERNPQKAATWYETAANNGNVIAMHNLAVLHATPNALSEKPDMATAFEWFKKAADHGVRDSQVNAGIFHTNGAANGETNLIEAYKWFTIAANSGDKDALSKKDIVGNALRPDQLEQAKAAARDWKPQQINRDANDVVIPDNWKDASQVVATSNVDKPTIKLVQTTLSKLGFDTGPADGVMGNKTREAISAFQQRIGLSPNGKIDAQLLEVLKKVSA